MVNGHSFLDIHNGAFVRASPECCGCLLCSFQRQRANADLLLCNATPFHKTLVHHPVDLCFCLILATALLGYYLHRFTGPENNSMIRAGGPVYHLFWLFLLSCVLFISPGRQMPTLPFVGLSGNQLMYVQNFPASSIPFGSQS